MSVPTPRTEPEPDTPGTYGRKRGRFGAHVAETTAALQRDLRAGKASAVAALAQLRAAVTGEPGQHYSVHTYTRVPERFLEEHAGDMPTAREWAKHQALTLYALHQQSIHDADMHRDGPALGTAIALLIRAADSPEAVRRRFAALGSATTFRDARYHLRTLIPLLREKRIALDYGLLAEDLVKLYYPDGPTQVRALWGRDFHRLDTTEPSPQPTAATAQKES
jgi:CRISPR system Cascade subunit CasB